MILRKSTFLEKIQGHKHVLDGQKKYQTVFYCNPDDVALLISDNNYLVKDLRMINYSLCKKEFNVFKRLCLKRIAERNKQLKI